MSPLTGWQRPFLHVCLGVLVTLFSGVTSLPLVLEACEKATHTPYLGSQAPVETPRMFPGFLGYGEVGRGGGESVLFPCWAGVLVSVLFLPVGLGMMLSRKRPCASPVFLPKVKWTAILLLSNCFMSGWRILFGEYLPTPSCFPWVPFFRLASCRVEVQLMSHSGPASSTGCQMFSLEQGTAAGSARVAASAPLRPLVSELLRQKGPSGRAPVL